MSRSIPSRFLLFAALFLVAFVIARPAVARGQTVVSTGANQNLQLTPGGTGNVIATEAARRTEHRVGCNPFRFRCRPYLYCGWYKQSDDWCVRDVSQ